MTKSNHTFRLSLIRMEQNNYCGATTKTYRNGKFVQVSRMSTMFNKKVTVGVANKTKSPYTDRKEYTNFRALRSDTGAIQVHQTGRYGNPHEDS